MKEKTAVRYKVADLTELSARIGKTVELEGREMALFLLDNGNVRAIENRCPHKGGTLAEGIVSGEYVYCTLHDWKISLQDGRVQAPDTGCIQTFEAVVEGNEVFILLQV